MPLRFNLRHLEDNDLHLKGELTPEELDANGIDELVTIRRPLKYDLSAELLGQNVLVHGRLEVPLDCECARCLKAFEYPVRLDEWACNLALEGEDRVPVENDLVDLTPYIREDILLAFPQHPLCKPECSGLPRAPQSQPPAASGADNSDRTPSQWAELDKLRFRD